MLPLLCLILLADAVSLDFDFAHVDQQLNALTLQMQEELINNFQQHSQKRSSGKADCEEECYKFPHGKPGYAERLITAKQNQTLSNISSIFRLWDNNHTNGIKYSRDSYNNYSAGLLDTGCKDFFDHDFGPCFNFTGLPWQNGFPLLGIPPAFGGYETACGILIQYLIGVNFTDPNHPDYNYVITGDSENPERNYKWRLYVLGNLVFVKVNNFLTPSGYVFAGNVLGCADYNMVNPKAKYWRGDNQELLRVATPFTSKQIADNQWKGVITPAISENLSPLRVIDECCNVGYGAITTTYANATYGTTPPLRQYNLFTLYI